MILRIISSELIAIILIFILSLAGAAALVSKHEKKQKHTDVQMAKLIKEQLDKSLLIFLLLLV